MYKFIKMQSDTRAEIIAVASAQSGLSEHIIEKDFWVSYLLDIIFNRVELEHNFLFKGGTSLSKCYGVIERFSEDIDLVYSQEDFEFEYKDEYLKNETLGSGKRKKLVKSLVEEAQKFTVEQFLPAIQKIIDSDNINGAYELYISEECATDLIFKYPFSIKEESKIKYLRPEIKIECGARSKMVPSSLSKVKTMLFDAIPTISDNIKEIQVLNPSRTFWEKAMLLYTANELNKLPHNGHRISRHIYDIAQLYKSGLLEETLTDEKLLLDVVKFSSIFFRSSINYDSINFSNFKLVPENEILEELREDYEKMSEMFYSDYIIPFEEIIDSLKEINKKINEN